MYIKVAVNYIHLNYKYPINYLEYLYYRCNEEIEKEIKVFVRVKVPFGADKLVGFVVELNSEPDIDDFRIKDILKIIDNEPLVERDYFNFIKKAADYYKCPIGDIILSILPKKTSFSIKSSTKTLEQPDFNLSQEQVNCISSIVDGSYKYYYLYGITGSGKTEVYINCINNYLKNGKSALYLVPEILLSKLIFKRIEKRIISKIYTLNSSMEKKKKDEQWNLIKNEKSCLVIGPRSSIFAPINNLAIIIIDEEHDSSYKSSEYPYISAKKLSFFRSEITSCKILLGSATPSLESYFYMKNKTFKTLRLTKRLAGGSLPKIEIVKLDPKNTQESVISDELKENIIENHKNKKQSILFLNRRGYHIFSYCKECKNPVLCPNCQVPLVLYQNGYMLCHHCDYEIKNTNVCQNCNSELLYTGYGTEKIVSQIKEIFPLYKIAKIDSNNKNEYDIIMKDFENGLIDILIGTQIIAKGIDFENVSLIGVILIEEMLNSKDFRGFERTFSMLMQISGRAGRFDNNSKVLIQTFSPKNDVLRYVKENDLKGFYEYEIQNRRALNLPPFSKIVKILLQSENEEKLANFCDKFVSYFQNIFTDVLFSFPEADYIKNKDSIFNYIIKIKFESRVKFNQKLKDINLYLQKKVLIQNYIFYFIDIDPESFY